MRRIFSGLLAGALMLGIVAGPVAAAGGAKQPNLVETAIAVNASGPYAGQFDTLIAAVLAADPAVLATLSGRGQFTVFAPTDDAFAAIGVNPGNVATVPGLTNILLYHVARGERLAADVVASSQIRMLNGYRVMVDGAVLTDRQGRDANIIVTDVRASNGVIHAIDSVLLP